MSLSGLHGPVVLAPYIALVMRRMLGLCKSQVWTTSLDPDDDQSQCGTGCKQTAVVPKEHAAGR